MSRIAGIVKGNHASLIDEMLKSMVKNGRVHRRVIANSQGTFGAVETNSEYIASIALIKKDKTLFGYMTCPEQKKLQNVVEKNIDPFSLASRIIELYEKEGLAFLSVFDGPFALALCDGKEFILARDYFGQAPLYWGFRGKDLCFASEIKALQIATDDINLLPPGSIYHNGIKSYIIKDQKEEVPESLIDAATKLRELLDHAVRLCTNGSAPLGGWLSGGLDSAALAALASRYQKQFYTFSTGMEGAPDLIYARITADYLGTKHHEVNYTLEEMLEILPKVIFHLESFDAPLVRSAIANYFVAKLASRHVKAVFSGEGADELFAGYSYFQQMHESELPEALNEAQRALSNTALQRVDRMAHAHGLTAYTCFLDQSVASYANKLPVQWKIDRQSRTEKWILREALKDYLPKEIRLRPKEKFWSGAGIANKLKTFVEGQIKNDEFDLQREIAPGLLLSSKEDLYYYRIFRKSFPSSKVVATVGLTAHRDSK